MKVAVIGGSGHVGTYLVPRLVEAGHEVINISRGRRTAYTPHPAWNDVETVVVDRVSEDAQGTFGKTVLKLRPEAVIDMICFDSDSARLLVDALKGHVRHYLFCGTIWVHGHSVRVPTTEDQPRRPFGEYGVRKAEAEDYLLREARMHGFPATCLHPGHIVGPGWAPLNPAGNFSVEAFSRLANGEPFTLPNLGLETVHHVHADDVAQAFMKALDRWSVSVGESFHVVSPQALTLRGYAEAVASWFGVKADLRFQPWEEWRGTVPREESEMTWDHIAHSPNCSIEKARTLLGYSPRYTSLEAVREALDLLIERGDIVVVRRT